MSELMDERARLLKHFEYQPGQNIYVVNFNGYIHRRKISYIDLKLMVNGVGYAYYDDRAQMIQPPSKLGKANYFSNVHSWHTTLKSARKVAAPMAEAKAKQDIEAVERDIARSYQRLGDLKGYSVLAIYDVPLERTDPGLIIELIGKAPKPDEIQMRSDQWHKLVGDGLMPADAKPMYKGMRVRFAG